MMVTVMVMVLGRGRDHGRVEETGAQWNIYGDSLVGYRDSWLQE